MILPLIFLISFNSFAGFNPLPESELYKYESKSPRKVKKAKLKRVRKKDNKELEALLKKLDEQDRRIGAILESQQKQVIIRQTEDKISALTRLDAQILNSIVATNFKPSKFVVKISESGDLEGAEIRCLGITFNRRVSGKCNLLVLEEEKFKIDVEIWDQDGAEGIIPDHFYSGEEKNFLTSSLSSFFAGVLDATKDRVPTMFGDSERQNTKNSALNGLLGVANNANSKIKTSGEKEMVISFVNSGKRVLAFFNNELILSGGNK